MDKFYIKGRQILFRNATLIFIIALAAFIFFEMPLFFTSESLLNLTSQASVFGMATVGLIFVILMGEIDISLGAQVYLSGVLSIRAYYATNSLFICFVVSILVGLAVGALNGYLISKIGIPSMVLTMSTMFICRGIGNLVVGVDSVINVSDPVFPALGQGKTFGIPTSALFFLGAVMIGWLLLTRTKFGRYIYAIGNNADALSAAGINILYVRLGAYVITGILCGIAGLINVSRIGGSSFELAKGLEFTCIAACVVGGASMTGGEGSMLGTLFGITVVASINQLLRLFNISTYLYDAIWGVVMLLTVLMNLLKWHQVKYEKEHRSLYPNLGSNLIKNFKANISGGFKRK